MFVQVSVKKMTQNRGLDTCMRNYCSILFLLYDELQQIRRGSSQGYFHAHSNEKTFDFFGVQNESTISAFFCIGVPPITHSTQVRNVKS